MKLLSLMMSLTFSTVTHAVAKDQVMEKDGSVSTFRVKLQEEQARGERIEEKRQEKNQKKRSLDEDIQQAEEQEKSRNQNL